MSDVIPDYYITPIEFNPSQAGKMTIWAGLSWATPPKRGYLTWDMAGDILLPPDASMVAVTVGRHHHISLVEVQIAKWPDVRWVVGGPATSGCESKQKENVL